nr:MAG: hypothetical protein [Tacheng Tick Virus 6]
MDPHHTPSIADISNPAKQAAVGFEIPRLARFTPEQRHANGPCMHWARNYACFLGAACKYEHLIPDGDERLKACLEQIQLTLAYSQRALTQMEIVKENQAILRTGICHILENQADAVRAQTSTARGPRGQSVHRREQSKDRFGPRAKEYAQAAGRGKK